MENLSKKKWEDLELSKDEIKNLGEALQKEEFRDLLLEYVKEINDPDNRKLYEKEITQLENERGVDIKFVHPTSGYVIKTSVDGKSKAFINICTNNNVKTPSSSPDVCDGNRGLNWSIPYCLAPPREDLDKQKNVCTVFDVVIHPDTLHLAKNNAAFSKLVNDTALAAIENNFSVTLDKINLKFPKIQFKGAKNATVIRKKIANFQPGDFMDMPNYPYPPVKEEQPISEPLSVPSDSKSQKLNKDSKYTAPKYTITHRNTVDMQDYTNDPMTKLTITIPNELVVLIDLPLLKFSSDMSIDVTEQSLLLVSEKPAKYKLELRLPYIVDSNKGNAKFDVITKSLTVTLPVIKNNISKRKMSGIDLTREDSGVESDSCNGRSDSISSDDELKNKTGHEAVKFASEDKLNLDQQAHVYNSTSMHFLKPDLHYTLPDFDCHLLKNILTFTLHVSNVNPESVEYCFFNDSLGFQLCFVSMGTGFFPINYAMCLLLLPKNEIKRETLRVEVWDNNVIAEVEFTSNKKTLVEYFVGIDKKSVKQFVTASSLSPPRTSNNLNQEKKCEENALSKDIDGRPTNECTDEDKLNPEHIATDKSFDSQIGSSESANEVKHYVPCEKISSLEDDEDKLAEEEPSVSESVSSLDESVSSPHRQPSKLRTLSESQQGKREAIKNRGILKIGRSLSESNVDDYSSWSAHKADKTKKTVRFSDVISKQTFRMNSSILGQRKKNQRKTRNKKRAQERRLSESGNESEYESDSSFFRGKLSNMQNMELWQDNADPSSSDVSDVSEVSDISESDDGTKEGDKPFVPCSSKKHHKRRGKKSARKYAATAKLQFMSN